jgi:hypothetical protein
MKLPTDKDKIQRGYPKTLRKKWPARLINIEFFVLKDDFVKRVDSPISHGGFTN